MRMCMSECVIIMNIYLYISMCIIHKNKIFYVTLCVCVSHIHKIYSIPVVHCQSTVVESIEKSIAL